MIPTSSTPYACSHSGAWLRNQTTTPKDIKQEPEQASRSTTNYNQPARNGPSYSPHYSSIGGSEYDSIEESEFDLNEDSEGDSEGDSGGEPDVDSGHDVEDDGEDDVSESDEDEDPKWPEYGESMRVPCLFRDRGCPQTFSTASMMIQHHELHMCRYDMMWLDSDIFIDEMEGRSRKVYDDIRMIYKCPNCKNKGGGRFRWLSGLVMHAESNVCNLRVRTGPVREIRHKLLDYADQW
ncbi:hypothetical protein FLAG1_10873 [Fusarium langsethiae]|uniref:Uncharacterized protein n=1 Tax=Fusarium langsethiae TaxID=179993 RepID=A0A0M9EN00_FUSLA|nr:hypothetical protein FLAG1_10873 [Fusarium langsethiae]GKU06629.1 unnamed protein product [Fusarium langsethiae]GKU21942.1 unnamed protein product [Fusarium langsethiae]